MQDAPELTLMIGSRFEDIELVDRLIEEVATQRSLPEEELSQLSLATREAAANAIRHGNASRPDGSVEIKILLEDESIAVVVRDEGPGFDPSRLPDPLSPENLLKPTGRGIFLMRQLMDEVNFEFPKSGGTVVTLRKNVPSGEA